jgi:hypothetical protein
MAEEPDAAALVLTTGVRRAGPGFAALLLSAASFALGVVALMRIPDVATGSERAPWLVGASALFLVGVSGVTYGLEAVIEWSVMRRRPRPAMRFTGRGIDYSAAYRGTFDLHVGWADVRDCRVVRPRGGGRFWCVEAASLVGGGDLPASLPPGSMPGPRRAPEFAARELVDRRRGGRPDVDLQQLTHLLAFGTPIVIDLDLAEGASPAEVDVRVREWTSGRCSLLVPEDRVRRRRWWPAVDRA